MIEKILEIRGDDWMKGMSYQTTLQYGGIFSQAANFDPFKRIGIMSPTVVPAAVGAAQITKTIKYIAPAQVSGTNFIFSWADNGSSPSLYKTNLQSGVTTDESSNVTVTSSSARGITAFGGYIIYARNTEIRSVTTALTGDTQILTTNVTSVEHPFTIGADKNLYFANGNYVGKINGETGLAATTGNDAQYFKLPEGMMIRDMVNDGRYLCIIADDAGTSTAGKVNCMVGYWDYSSDDFTTRYDFLANGVTAAALLDGAIYVLGKDYMYITSVNTEPRSIFSFLGTTSSINSAPNGRSSVSVQGNSMYWASGAKIYAYGSLVSGTKKFFYQPYTFDNTVTAFIQTGVVPFGATTNDELFAVGLAPATAATASLLTSNIILPRPYKLEYARVTMLTDLASGESVSFYMQNRSGAGSITGTSTFSFANEGAKQTHIFRTESNTQGFQFFDEFKIGIDSNAPIEKIEIFGSRGGNQLQVS